MSLELKNVNFGLLEDEEENPLLPSLEAFKRAPSKWKEELEGWEEIGNKYRALGEFNSAYKKTYTIGQLSTLAKDAVGRARFVLKEFSPQGLVVAKEGRPTHEIPSHTEMALNCPVLAAGTFYFDENNRIKAIDHKSGGFKTPFKSLRPVLELLRRENMLADQFTLIRLDAGGGGAVLERIDIKLDALAQLKSLEMDNPAAESKPGSGKKRPHDGLVAAATSVFALPPPSPRKKFRPADGMGSSMFGNYGARSLAETMATNRILQLPASPSSP